MRHKNRRRLAIEGTVLQVSGPDASTPYLLCMYRDITSEVDAEKELRARERKTEVLADALPAVVGIASRDRGFYYFNRAWYAYTGLTLEESTPAPWSTVIHPDDHPLVWDWVQAVYSGRMIEQEVRYRRHDGAYRWFLTRSVPMAPLGDDPGSAVLTAVDITDIKEANQATESARKQLETVLRGITDGVTAQDRNETSFTPTRPRPTSLAYATVEELLEAPRQVWLLASISRTSTAGRSCRPTFPGRNPVAPNRQVTSFSSSATMKPPRNDSA
jgi:PAS domain S-box-containing protein